MFPLLYTTNTKKKSLFIQEYLLLVYSTHHKIEEVRKKKSLYYTWARIFSLLETRPLLLFDRFRFERCRFRNRGKFILLSTLIFLSLVGP